MAPASSALVHRSLEWIVAVDWVGILKPWQYYYMFKFCAHGLFCLSCLATILGRRSSRQCQIHNVAVGLLNKNHLAMFEYIRSYWIDLNHIQSLMMFMRAEELVLVAGRWQRHDTGASSIYWIFLHGRGRRERQHHRLSGAADRPIPLMSALDEPKADPARREWKSLGTQTLSLLVDVDALLVDHALALSNSCHLSCALPHWDKFKSPQGFQQIQQADSLI